ncbi:2-amino-4-hydroxy-6-hydroxymethyldihydropteridine diphosphokinase [Flavisphingomonas formosensis]|uniref:2-amino-4-hydroxy-6- hydroxymethyldihydropteridine diphosphokinase n=1 Tax=Flavisphingomonas formosensis TaxID=861534 RepID=UPI0012FCC030|nr:2-amino-4-hydroxy-6-hydroxymethyldihydropteridine diphosphokinase [Sphingomonas formosensis]
MRYHFAIALGSNRRHGRHGAPRHVIHAALTALGSEDVSVLAISPILTTAPLGPAGRSFANAAALIATDLEPDALLTLLKRIEHDFGRRRGRRWGPRVIDLDIILWSGGRWTSSGPGRLTIPHRSYAERDFVLRPLAAIAPHWRHPAGHRTVRHLLARVTRRSPVDRNRVAP